MNSSWAAPNWKWPGTGRDLEKVRESQGVMDQLSWVFMMGCP